MGRPMIKRALAVLFVAALLAIGCSRTAIIDKMAPPDVRQASTEAVSDLRSRHFGALSRLLSSELASRVRPGDFEKMAAFFPDDAPRAVTPAEYYFSFGTGWKRYDISYEYEFTHVWILARFSWVLEDGKLRVSAFRIYPMHDSIEHQNAFTLSGRGVSQYLVLLLGIAAFSASLAALVQCIRARGLRRKWLWILFIVVGFGTLSVNWNTGDYQFALLRFQLMSFSGAALFGQPWTLAVSAPVGALVFLDRMKRRRGNAAAPLTPGPPPLV
jgi:hypothetical protein